MDFGPGEFKSGGSNGGQAGHDDVLHEFEGFRADRKPQRPFFNPQLTLLLRRKPTMAGRTGVADRRRDLSQRGARRMAEAYWCPIGDLLHDLRQDASPIGQTYAEAIEALLQRSSVQFATFEWDTISRLAPCWKNLSCGGVGPNKNAFLGRAAHGIQHAVLIGQIHEWWARKQGHRCFC